MRRITIKPVSPIGRVADALLEPVMRFVSGAPQEAPQRTHAWNNAKVSSKKAEFLSGKYMVHCSGDPTAQRRWLLGCIPCFHMPRFGGWKRYAVVAVDPRVYNGRWRIGWKTVDVIGVTRHVVFGPARVLIGPHPVAFFALSERGQQLPLVLVDEGVIGDGGPHCFLPLF